MWFGSRCLSEWLTCCVEMHLMFSISGDCSSLSSNIKRFCLPCCLFLNPILLWHLSVEQNVRSVSRALLLNGPFLFTSISVRCPSITPPTPPWMWHCVCACHERRAADKKGVPRTVKTAQVRTSFGSEWSLGIHRAWWIMIRARRRMFVCLSHPLRVHLVVFF